MKRRVISGALSIFFVFCSCCAYADCKGVVKIQDSSLNDNNIVLSVRVYASHKKASRVVFYMLFGDVRVQGLRDTTMLSSVTNSASSTVEMGEEYVDDQVEFWAGPLEAVSPARIKEILVTGCYIQ